MRLRILSVVMTIFLVAFLGCGCSVPSSEENPSSGGSSITLDAVIPADTSSLLDVEAMEEDRALSIVFSENGISCSEISGCKVEGTALKITAPGTYRLSGTCSDGSVTVAKDLSDVFLILDGLHLTCLSGPSLTVNKSASVCLYLAEGSQNSLADSSAEQEEGAALKFKSGSALVFGGDGSLTVTGNFKNGIKGGAGAVCRILSGNLTVNAANNALSCDHSLEIQGGTLHLTAQNDGLKASVEEGDSTSMGNLLLSGGSVTVDAVGDGISADGYLELSGGTVVVTTTGKVSSSGGSDFGKGPGGGFFPGGFFAPSQSGQTTATAASSASSEASSKGLKAGALKITGGDLIVSSTDHALHCDGEALIEGGILALNSSSGKGIATHGDLTVAGDLTKITVTAATEGIESKRSFTLNGGTVRVEHAGDDGVNLGGIASGDTLSEHALTVNGGSLYCYADGDGIDTNGTFTINGGTVVVFGPSSGGNSCLDLQYTSTYNGGTILALAYTSSMWNEVVGHTKGDYLYNLSVGTLDGSSLVEIFAADGRTLIAMDCPLKGSSGIYFMTDLVDNLSSCTVKIDGSPISVTAGTGTGSTGGFSPGGPGGPAGPGGPRPGR